MTKSSMKLGFPSASPPTPPASAPKPGAAGKDTRGIIRQHQFQKVELVKFTRPEEVRRRARTPHPRRRRDPRSPQASLPPRPALHRRHRLLFRKDLRSRSLAPRPAALSRNFFLLQLRGLPGSPRQHSLQADRQGQERIRTHDQRQRSRRWPHLARDSRKLPAG